MFTTYSLRKSEQVLKKATNWYERVYKTLPKHLLQELETDLQELDDLIMAKDKKRASEKAKKVRSYWLKEVKKTYKGSYSLRSIGTFFLSLLIAFAIAILIRQMWFEPYQIPTGSMRPTLRELDHLTVTKLPFGINIPLKPGHFAFWKENIKRGRIVVWSGDDIDLPETDDLYFYLIPYKRQFVKRLIGVPGDSVYFYGGKIYGIDKEGKPLQELLDLPFEYIPFITFEGRIEQGENPREIYFKHFNKRIGRFLTQTMTGQVFNKESWVKDEPLSVSNNKKIETFSQWLGMRNYAMAALLAKKDLDLAQEIEEAPLYLQLSHTPSTGRLELNPPLRFRLFKTIIPLHEKHIERLFNALYTGRFFIQNEKMARYSPYGFQSSKDNPLFKGVPDGTYEFYFGSLEEIGRFGIPYQLKESHPLLDRTSERLQQLFHFGIDASSSVNPTSKRSLRGPRRYAYFSKGDLYVMGEKIIEKDDPILINFLKKEIEKQSAASAIHPYIPFIDYGPPVNEDGEFDLDFIRTFGITVPEGSYLMLGDNHAMSADSRDFGFVPVANIRGAPSLIVWPFPNRFGFADLKTYPLFTPARMVGWSIIIVIAIVSFWVIRNRRKRGIFKKLS